MRHRTLYVTVEAHFERQVSRQNSPTHVRLGFGLLYGDDPGLVTPNFHVALLGSLPFASFIFPAAD
jgi:hypothetical protein